MARAPVIELVDGCAANTSDDVRGFFRENRDMAIYAGYDEEGDMEFSFTPMKRSEALWLCRLLEARLMRGLGGD